MNAAPILPAPDALPAPAPIWVFKTLLLLTFFLHLVPMNLLLGGGIIAAVERLRGGPGSPSHELSKAVGKAMPAIIAFTVTLGVAPLLFLQVLYGHLFYSSSVLVAWPWFLIVPVLIVIYYLAYAISFRGDRLGGLGTGFAWLVSLGALGIAFVLVTNVSLSLRPEAWAAMYHESARGMHVNLGDPTMIPRYLHFLIGALAVGGLVIAGWGLRQRDETLSLHMQRTGSIWFASATGLQIAAGFWFLLSLPRPVMSLFMGESTLGTAALWLGVAAALAALAFIIDGVLTGRLRRRIPPTLGLLGLVLVAMILARDVVRDGLLGDRFSTASLEVEPQTGVMLLFVVTLVAGLAVLGWMLRAFSRAPGSERN